jgi:Zn-dependent alcohol dehydrogenase
LDRLVGRRIALGEINEAFERIGSDGVARTVITEF